MLCCWTSTSTWYPIQHSRLATPRLASPTIILILMDNRGKLMIQLQDGNIIESVIMRYGHIYCLHMFDIRYTSTPNLTLTDFVSSTAGG